MIRQFLEVNSEVQREAGASLLYLLEENLYRREVQNLLNPWYIELYQRDETEV